MGFVPHSKQYFPSLCLTGVAHISRGRTQAPSTAHLPASCAQPKSWPWTALWASWTSCPAGQQQQQQEVRWQKLPCSPQDHKHGQTHCLGLQEEAHRWAAWERASRVVSACAAYCLLVFWPYLLWQKLLSTAPRVQYSLGREDPLCNSWIPRATVYSFHQLK